MPQPATPTPIFILAPLPRSGTNFLWDLLRLHQDCAAGRSPLWEDYLLRNGHHLSAFATAAQSSWDPVWGPTEHLRPELLRSLGDALVGFLTVDPTRHLVTKSPSLDNLEMFFDLFADAHLLLLVRDGRDVVDSGMATFGWDLEGGARAWAKGVDRITRFLQHPAVPDDQCTVVRYEDLHGQPHEAMSRVLTAVGLPLDRYEFAEIDRLPVRGSSQHRGAQRNTIHWDPVPRTQAFKPTGRWRRWNGDAVDAFVSVAGRQLGRLGYPM